MFYYWFHKDHLPFHPIHITPCPLFLFTSHHNIITQPYIHSFYIIDFPAHISSHFLQAIVYLISFSTVHRIYIYHIWLHSYHILMLLPTFSHICFWKVMTYNHRQDIYRLFHVLAPFPFTATESEQH